MKRLIFVLFALMILSVNVNAETFTVDVDKKAEYTAGILDNMVLQITNNGPSDTFSVSAFGFPASWVNPEGVSLGVPSGSTGLLNITVKPSGDASPGAYEYTFFVTRLSNNEKVAETILLRIAQPAPAIIKSFDLSCIRCVSSVAATMVIENTGDYIFNGNLEVRLFLDGRTETKNVVIEDLGVGKRQSITQSFFLKSVDPGTYRIEAKLIQGGNVLFAKEQGFALVLSENIIYDRKETSNILGKFVALTAFNDGNQNSGAEIEDNVTISWYGLFSGPQPSEKNNEEYRWILELKPGETTQVKYSIFYWPVIVLVLLTLAGGIYTYFEFMSVTIEKLVPENTIARMGKDITVSLHVKNRLREMESVIVSDLIPPKFSIVAQFETIKPVLRKISGGTELVWRIGNLRSHEERIVNYKIRPAESFVMTHLPKASVKARYQNKVFEKHSNLVHLRGHKERVTSLPIKITK